MWRDEIIRFNTQRHLELTLPCSLSTNSITTKILTKPLTPTDHRIRWNIRKEMEVKDRTGSFGGSSPKSGQSCRGSSRGSFGNYSSNWSSGDYVGLSFGGSHHGGSTGGSFGGSPGESNVGYWKVMSREKRDYHDQPDRIVHRVMAQARKNLRHSGEPY